jgi:ABC-type proline/glycine betaine transport system permease subunit
VTALILAALVVWLLLGLPVGLLVGRAVRLRDRVEPARREDRWAA